MTQSGRWFQRQWRGRWSVARSKTSRALRSELTPQCGGLFAISLGLSANFPDDHEMLDHGMAIYDAL
jgi:hypothetical protein